MWLYNPTGFKEASPGAKFRICNGTGASGTPDCLVKFLDSFNGWGIDLKETSDRHDWQYHFGKHWWQKIWADIIYLLNMTLVCIYAIFVLPLSHAIGSLIMFPVRMGIRVLPYFLAVLLFGWRAFYRARPNEPDKNFKLRPTIFHP